MYTLYPEIVCSCCTQLAHVEYPVLEGIYLMLLLDRKLVCGVRCRCCGRQAFVQA